MQWIKLQEEVVAVQYQKEKKKRQKAKISVKGCTEL